MLHKKDKRDRYYGKYKFASSQEIVAAEKLRQLYNVLK